MRLTPISHPGWNARATTSCVRRPAVVPRGITVVIPRGTHRTRVSEMRHIGARADARQLVFASDAQLCMARRVERGGDDVGVVGTS